MRIKGHIRCVAVGIFAAIYLAGCSQNGTAPGPVAAQESGVSEAGAGNSEAGAAQESGVPEAGGAQESDAPEAGGAQESGAPEAGGAQESGVPEADAQVDRYQEITDRSGDDGKLVFYFLDLEVGPDAKDKSGDSTVIISPDGKVMLLDAGHPDSGGIIVQALKDLGV